MPLNIVCIGTKLRGENAQGFYLRFVCLTAVRMMSCSTLDIYISTQRNLDIFCNF